MIQEDTNASAENITIVMMVCVCSEEMASQLLHKSGDNVRAACELFLRKPQPKSSSSSSSSSSQAVAALASSGTHANRTTTPHPIFDTIPIFDTKIAGQLACGANQHFQVNRPTGEMRVYLMSKSGKSAKLVSLDTTNSTAPAAPSVPQATNASSSRNISRAHVRRSSRIITAPVRLVEEVEEMEEQVAELLQHAQRIQRTTG